MMQVALVREPKDKEMSATYKQAIEMLSQALEVWPAANVKFNYLENLLSSSQPLEQSKDISTNLTQGLDVMNKVLEKQPNLFILNNFQQITQVCSQTIPFLHHTMIETVNFEMVFSFGSMISFISISFAVTRALFQQQGNGYREVIMYIVENGL
jgi:transformation/transcription domain-associated protein